MNDTVKMMERLKVIMEESDDLSEFRASSEEQDVGPMNQMVRLAKEGYELMERYRESHLG